MPFVVSVRKNAIPQVQASIADKSLAAVKDSSIYAQDIAQRTAPVRTGSLAVSFYVNGPQNYSDYSQHASQAQRMNPAARIVPELQAAIVDPKVGQLRDLQTGRFTFQQAIVSSAVEHSLFVEEGTVHMAPRPVLRNAALQAEQQFKNAMSKVADGY